MVSTALAPIPNGSETLSYIVKIPVESATANSPVSLKALALTDGAVTYARTAVITHPGYPGKTIQDSITLTPEQLTGGVYRQDFAMADTTPSPSPTSAPSKTPTPTGGHPTSSPTATPTITSPPNCPSCIYLDYILLGILPPTSSGDINADGCIDVADRFAAQR